MKKTIFMLVLIVMMSGIFAETVILKDGQNFTGKLAGKKDGFIYLQKSRNDIYRFRIGDIETIKNDAEQPITTIFLRKKDFLEIDKKQAKTIEITKKIPLKITNYQGNIGTTSDITKMSDREFELYLTNKKVNEINGIRKTMWKIWYTNLIIIIGSGVAMILIFQ